MLLGAVRVFELKGVVLRTPKGFKFGLQSKVRAEVLIVEQAALTQQIL